MGETDCEARGGDAADPGADDVGDFRLVDAAVDVALDSGVGKVCELGLVDAGFDACREADTLDEYEAFDMEELVVGTNVKVFDEPGFS